MSGFAGLRLLKNRKREKNVSNEHVQNSLKERDDRVVGLVVLIADLRRKNGFDVSGAQGIAGTNSVGVKGKGAMERLVSVGISDKIGSSWVVKTHHYS
jgi:hypothetical protein